MRWPGHSVLQVPVAPLDGFVRGLTGRQDAAYLSRDPGFTHAHVTVLGPFLASPDAAETERVRRVVASVAAFAVVLERVARFPDGTLHLVPEPDGPFRELTARLAEAFPQCPPYEGRYAELHPHLTLDLAGPGVDEDSLRRDLGDLLPARCRAERVDLAWWEQGATRRLTWWPLG
ncbi:2'-5' RNA ligase family protein [Nocardioides sp. Leaf374]|uniref:2'-5' RNA ligase family protein n=1 Tax=Nocardioides sp. Leaf374 TaxID=2876560 RepID=UPI001E5AC512|nr:2'-5' RNA ligase family protein [Nocardioides sp. Leaf374]